MADEFDYVIVGGGTAGCVPAARLSENPALRVCLLGWWRRQRPAIRMPAGVVAMMPRH
jgi:choline dehydrogenase